MTWPTVKLGDVCEISRGGSPRPIQNYITENDDGLNWIKIGDVNEGEKYITKTAEKIKPSGLSHTRQIKAGDFLLSNSMSFGRPYISKIDGCIHDGWLMLRDVKNNFSQDYLYHMLTSVTVKDQFIKYATGAVVKNLNKEVVSKVIVPIPPLPEQQRIAAILDKAEEIKSKREQAMAKLDELGKSMFVEMFGDPIKNTKNLHTLKVKEVCKLINGRAFKPTEWRDVGMPIIRIQNLNDESKPFNYTAEEFDGKYLVKKDDVLFSWSGTPGTSFGCFKWNRANGWLNQHIFKVELKDNLINADFFIVQMNLKIGELIAQAHGGVGLQHVTKGMVDDLQLLIPDIKLQNMYSEKLKKIEFLKNSIEKSNNSINSLMHSLQHQAFTTGFNA